MDIQELMNELQSSIENAQSEIQNVINNADEAAGDAREAQSYASNAEDEAERASSDANDALQALGTLQDEFSQLRELVDDLLKEEGDPGGSDLQKDINKWKAKVLQIRAKHPSATPATIAKHLEIGEFLVSRILELNKTAA
jgi:ElaB/YqjD/DUF883 family membrane-anchored ribosome-binding protein